MTTSIQRPLPLRGSYLMPSFDHARVADAMHPGVLACEPDATITDVARLMASHHVHCIVVIDTTQEDSGEPLAWRLITDRDILRAAVIAGSEPTAGSLSRDPTLSITPDLPLRDAAELMYAHELSHLIVVDPTSRRPTGVLSTADVSGLLAWGEG